MQGTALAQTSTAPPGASNVLFRDNTGREAPGHPLYLVMWVWSSPTALHSPGPAVGHSPACPQGSGRPGRVTCGQRVPKEPGAAGAWLPEQAGLLRDI